MLISVYFNKLNEEFNNNEEKENLEEDKRIFRIWMEYLGVKIEN